MALRLLRGISAGRRGSALDARHGAMGALGRLELAPYRQYRISKIVRDLTVVESITSRDGIGSSA